MSSPEQTSPHVGGDTGLVLDSASSSSLLNEQVRLDAPSAALTSQTPGTSNTDLAPISPGQENAVGSVAAMPPPEVLHAAAKKHFWRQMLPYIVAGFMLLCGLGIVVYAIRAAMGVGKWKLHDRTYPHNKHLGDNYYDSLE